MVLESIFSLKCRFRIIIKIPIISKNSLLKLIHLMLKIHPLISSKKDLLIINFKTKIKIVLTLMKKKGALIIV